VRAVLGVERWGLCHAVGKPLPFSITTIGWTDEQRGFVVEAYYENNRSVIAS
jgi:hypothetical protein